ncbi:hypothetical protein CANMA_000102 [Candida margitis]|uniref:uncharacterized protein n=1 Tax=Candida margitis TaxID=1775924 RepID=UPI0022271ED6|nr:uncharacterized protein CANMA_000102 [Candida margitis]KAI5970942.1 hypothetical protein CANMA_000102 [Candida margitis]
MLIKPITETRTPRHTLDDEDTNAKPNPIPEIKISLNDASLIYDYVLIVPHTISLIQDQLPKQENIGQILIDYPDLIKDLTKEVQEEYDEDEQLYAALENEALKNKFKTEELAIYLSSGVLSIVVPHFTNTIAYNVLARQLIRRLKPSKEWILLAPSTLNNNQSINQLPLVDTASSSASILSQVPVLRPPHSITGIAAATLSQLNFIGVTNVVTLVLNSEGHLGFEKSDNDAIVDTAFVLSDIITIDKEEYIKNVSSKVRKFNGYSNLGIYI